MKNRKTKGRWVSLFLVSVIGFYAIANARVLSAETGRSFTVSSQIPHHRVGIVLGCSPRTGIAINPFFEGRIAAAAKLYHAGKIDRVLVSGDNGRPDYDEPTAMAKALVAEGVPADRVTKDFAGFSTIDTMIRAKKIFGLNDATVITDDFHIARALYFAEGAGIKADGFPSSVPASDITTSTHVREVFARGRALLDQEVFHAQPRYLGKQEAVP